MKVRSPAWPSGPGVFGRTGHTKSSSWRGAALAVLKGEEAGQLLSVDWILPMTHELAAQGQSARVVFPDRHWPRGILLAPHVSLPTHSYLSNVADFEHAILPVTLDIE